MKITHRRKSIRASKDIVLDDYKYIDFRDGYEIYRKGNSWAAQDSDHRCDPFAITYEQARGIEPIDGCDSNAQKVQKGLDKKLMSSKQICASIDKNEVFKLLDESGGYTDYNQKIEDVIDAFGVSPEVAEGYVWDWTSQLDPDDNDEYDEDDDEDDSDDDDFDHRWDEHFGEPTTEVFTTEEFKQWMKEVQDFE